ncbi:hypothetical protein ACFY05_32460 [Microtetraspora fusca]|uniref:Uncharacterized protein n=1 Tax=Microtetraspora fusca TaxID=1997 RepID=A0ABW6VE47_MICFU
MTTLNETLNTLHYQCYQVTGCETNAYNAPNHLGEFIESNHTDVKAIYNEVAGFLGFGEHAKLLLRGPYGESGSLTIRRHRGEQRLRWSTDLDLNW